MRRLLLISNAGQPLFYHCRDELSQFLASSRRIGFVTAAAMDHESAYFENVQRSLLDLGVVDPNRRQFVQLAWDGPWWQSFEEIDAVFVRGGNTYVLLSRLRASGLLTAIKERVLHGSAYVGSSAGANIAGPNILTTNDWNVIGSTDFAGLGLVEFNINPHFLDEDRLPPGIGESRVTRIEEYLSQHKNPVVGLEAGAVIRVNGDVREVVGHGNAWVFNPQHNVARYQVGDIIEYSSFDAPTSSIRCGDG